MTKSITVLIIGPGPILDWANILEGKPIERQPEPQPPSLEAIAQPDTSENLDKPDPYSQRFKSHARKRRK